MKTKSNLERVAFIVLLGILMYLMGTSCTTSRIKDKPRYPYYYE